ncbi:hypothetical protein EAY46_25695 [Vibrio anguillarum]|uniref:Transposase n=1 Tax=Vibrio anguillarum TaxID=55601 RepID=A0ABR9ZD36_VIBAN|nr:hypothetical protein [Vibrio anguillarum]
MYLKIKAAMKSHWTSLDAKLLILLYCAQEKRRPRTSLNYDLVGWRKLILFFKLLFILKLY